MYVHFASTPCLYISQLHSSPSTDIDYFYPCKRRKPSIFYRYTFSFDSLLCSAEFFNVSRCETENEMSIVVILDGNVYKEISLDNYENKDIEFTLEKSGYYIFLVIDSDGNSVDISSAVMAMRLVDDLDQDQNDAEPHPRMGGALRYGRRLCQFQWREGKGPNNLLLVTKNIEK